MSAPAGAWSDALAGFTHHLDWSHRSEATCQGYLKHMGWLAESVDSGPWDLTAAELGSWLAERSWSRGTRRKVLVSLRMFYTWAVAAGHVEWAPVAGLPSPAPEKRGPKPRALPAAWVEPLEGYLGALAGRSASEGTIGQRRYWVGRLAEVAADPWTVSTQQLALWLSNPDWQAETKRAARGALRGFYRWAVEAGHLEQSPADGLESVLVPRGLPRPAPDAAVHAAIAAADDRTRLAVLLAALAGLRRAEIAGLHTSQIDVYKGVILVVGKGGHHRVVPLHPLLREEFVTEMSRRRRGRHGSGWGGRFCTEDGWLFPSDRENRAITPNYIGRLVSRVLPGDWTAHTLRHRFASETYAHERDLLAVQRLLGHAKPETTARYAQVPDASLAGAVTSIQLPSFGPRAVVAALR